MPHKRLRINKTGTILSYGNNAIVAVGAANAISTTAPR